MFFDFFLVVRELLITYRKKSKSQIQVLLNGTCVLNESILTGESTPVVKTWLPQPDDPFEFYNLDKHKRHTLFCGTFVLETSSYDDSKITAVVIRTGMSVI
jgi:cation-transporting ATPase 13A3/4/5